MIQISWDINGKFGKAYILFVDIKNFYTSVNLPKLWEILEGKGFTEG